MKKTMSRQCQKKTNSALCGALLLQMRRAGSVLWLAMMAAWAPAAQLGFDAPRTTVRLAEPFVVTVIAQFEPNEPDVWESGACPVMSILAGWPAGIQVISCTWNTAAWQFATQGWEQSADNAAVWARGQARDPHALTGAVAIATLVCIAQEPDDDTFYFEIDPDPEAGSSMTVREGSAVVDILGDPEDAYDGGDEIALTIANTPGYILSLTPANNGVPLAVTSVAVTTAIRPASEAAPYDHVRIELAYDASVFAFSDVAALRASVPSLFNTIAIHCPAGGELPPPLPNCVISTNCDEGEVYVELWCAPTNYAGPLFVWHLLPQSIEANSDVTLGFSDPLWFTTVDRYGVDLLGMWDDDEDGSESTDISVQYVDGLRMFLESTIPYGYAGSTAFARVMLAKSLPAPVRLDGLDLELFFEPALLACDSNAFLASPALSVSGLHHMVTLATNAFVADPARPDSLWYPWTATAARIQVDLPAGLLMTQDVLWVGTLAFTPQTTGAVGFVRGDICVMLDLDDIHDENACGNGWPFVLGIAGDSGAHRSVTVTLSRDASEPATLIPGQNACFNVVSCGDALANATYDLRWIFDGAGLTLQAGTGVSIEPLVINATTATVVRVQGTASTAATTCLARIQFTAMKPGAMLLTPVSYALSASAYCRVTESGLDVLGAPGVPGDGVFGASITVANPAPVELVFEPHQTLFAGVQALVVLSLANPHATYWDALTARILLDTDGAMLPAATWQPQLQNVQPLAFNSAIALVSNLQNVSFYDATLALQVAATTGSTAIASLPLMPLDVVSWMYDTTTNTSGQSVTDVRLGDLSVMDENAADNINVSKWAVFPHGASIWLSDSALPPVLGSNYTLTVRVNNPNGVALQRVTFAYAFDAAVMEVSAPVLAPGFSANAGGVWISNNSMDGYLCGDIWCDTITTARDVAVLHVTIRPKLNQPLELLPEFMYILDNHEIGMGLWTVQQFNVLELFNEFPEDLCPAWHRGVVWLDIPQLVMDDQDLLAFESLVVDLHDILRNGSTNKTYRWWIEGAQNHVSAVFSLPNQTLALSSLDNWSGSVQFRLCCQELGAPYVGDVRFSVNVTGDDAGDQLAIQLPRDEFIAAAGAAFEQCTFSIVNATGAVQVTADITGPDQQCHSILVRNAATGLVGDVLDIRGNGSVVWNTRAYAPGYYRGRLRVRYPNLPAVEIPFAVDLFSPGQDDDGDTFFLLYKSPAGRKVITGRSVEIQNGTDRDTLTMIVRRGPEGDGLVALDAIVSDSGMKRMTLKGGVNIITLDGPLGTLAMDGGSIGQLTVTRGGIGTVLIHTRWLKGDGAFAENVGIARGVAAEGSINTIMVVGGAIGSYDAPALIRTDAGSIGSISTVLKQRIYASDGDREIVASCDEGANLFATIAAPRGSIGKLFAKGGSIGTPDGYPTCILRAGGNLRIARAMADVYDGTPLGGSIFAAVAMGGAVGCLDALGGDITRSEILEPDDINDSEHLPVRIAARSIKSLKALLRLNNYDGSKIAYGGTVHAVLDVQFGIDAITVVGGHACLLTSAAQAPGRIRSLLVRRVVFKEYPDDTVMTFRGGDLIASAVSTASSQNYKSSAPGDYHGPLLQLAVDGTIRNSWIGFASQPDAHTLLSTAFRYGALENSEVWEVYRGHIYVNGR